MSKLSTRQQAILDFIKSEVREKGYPPSVREIGEAVGLASSSTVHGHLARLEEKGYIRRDPTKPRAIEVLDPYRSADESMVEQDSSVLIPLVGKVTAGEPITAVENVDEYLPLPLQLVGNKDSVFLLTVQGESMINAGILDGDKLIVHQQQAANNGDIIVAMTEEGEATVKRFYKEQDHVRLQPENDQMHALLLSDVTILGKVIGLLRTTM
ncbi:transcriptional repressor LexA [Mechercharimyces sp. CAU 1602]|uniref:transcriptional repressor LexA n=1 Tax=Mechercharimyces sp. CAU 1602 TaxID=2973933 RepID=UPI00216334A5|nr:transcriptional repressor LexA [Mechercharimyces sp. CAU 1602]MCS1351041.1 transcriptional repressor LexA [Mechercharimyces sp. CAU 1602]